ncbi:hypothetical protein AC1031_004720 [Aphanomyces cochlioides]|nr:hypothetical protein AC1031_004720 [Aphanomyces cochlioides]
MSADAFYLDGMILAQHTPHGSAAVGIRRFREMFGTSPRCCSLAWRLVGGNRPLGSLPIHLLWAFLFLKTYATEAQLYAITGADEKTFRKWVWQWIRAIAALDVIHWGNRFVNASPGATMFVSLDGTDFRILEPTPFDAKWFSHKFKGAGLRYEIGLCIHTGHIVWAHGGLPCGEWPDLRLARDAYIYAVNRGEKTLADRGYADPSYFVYPSDERRDNARQKQIMARHETCNRRLKQFRILGGIFRHRLTLHPTCFHAVVNLTQIMIENGEPLYSVFET